MRNARLRVIGHRRWPVALGACALIALIAAAAAHAPAVRARALAQVVAFLGRRGIVTRASRLDYNLLRFDFRLVDVAVATASAPDEPFFSASEIHVVLGWGTLLGRLELDAIDLLRPRVALSQTAGGVANWPTSSGPSTPASPAPAYVRRLRVSDLEFSWRDATSGTSINIAGLSADLGRSGAETAGLLKMGGPAQVRWRSRATDLRALEGRLSWNGRDLSLQALRVVLPEGSLTVDGRVDTLLGDPRLDLRVSADANLADIRRWIDRAPRLAGTLRVDTQLSGPPSTLDAIVSLTGRDIAVAGLERIDVRATGRASRDAAEITTLAARVAGGEVSGRGRLSLDGGPGEAALDWKALDVDALAKALPGFSISGLSARLDGDLDARWSRPQLAALSLHTKTFVAPKTDAELPLAGTVSLDVRRERWTLEAEQLLARSARATINVFGTLNADDVSQSSMEGTAEIVSDDLGHLAQTVARTQGIQVPASFAGEGEGRFTVRGTIGSPQLVGAIDAKDLHYVWLPTGALHARASIARDEIALDDITAQMGASSGRGQVRLLPRSGRIEGRVQISLPNVNELAAVLPAAVGADGALDVTATLSGSLTTPHVAAIVRSSGLTVAGQSLDRVDAAIDLSGRTIAIGPSRLVASSGSVEAQGQVDMARNTYVVHATARDFPIRPIKNAAGDVLAPMTATLTGELDGNGPFKALDGRGRLALADVRWESADVGRVDADLVAAGRNVSVDLRAPDMAFRAAGEIGIDPNGAVSARGRWDPQDLAAFSLRLRPEAARGFSGSAALGFEVSGARDRPQELLTSVDLERLEIDVNRQPLRLVRPTRLEYDGRSFRAREASVSIGSSTLAVSGTVGDEASSGLTASLVGSLSDFSFVRRLLRGESPTDEQSDEIWPTGAVNVQLAASGPLTQPILSGTLRVNEGRLLLAPGAAVTDLGMAARYDAGVLALDSLEGAFNGAVLTATGRIPSAVYRDLIPRRWRDLVPPTDGPAALRAQIRALTPQAAGPFIDPTTLESLRGMVEASITLEADRPAIDRVRGTVTLDRAELSVSGVSFDQQTPTRLTVHDGRLDVAEWNWGRGDNEVTLRGGVSLVDEQAVDVTLAGALDLGLVNAFSSVARTAGRADSEVHVGGTVRAPTFDGWVTFSNGDLRSATPRIVVTDLAGTVTLDRNSATLHRLSATVNGGNAEIAGTFRHQSLKPVDGEITVTGRQAALAFAGLRSEADADLTVRFEPRSPLVSGTVTLARSAYREPLSLTSGLLAALRTSSTLGESGAASPRESVRLDVRVRTEDDLLVDNNYAQLAMSADVRVIGTAAQPGLSGRATLPEGGLVFFGGNRYRLSQEGSIDFANPTRIEPDLDLQAVTRVGATDITLSLKGTPTTLQTSLTSEDPDLSQSDLVSLLVTGRTMAQAAESGYRPGSEELLGYLSGEIFGAAGRVVGLDTFRVERASPDIRYDAGLVAGQTDPGARLTFGRSVGDKVQVVFSQSLRESGGLTWIVSYLPRVGIELQTVSLDNNDRLYDFRHDVVFGMPRTSRVRPVAPQAPIVSAVRVSGAASDEATLRSRLKLAVGDRFNFFRWQDDRDRLEAFYHEAANFEARVTTRRLPKEAPATGSVEIEYEIRRGPHTTIVINGTSFPRSVMAAMEDAWSRAVVDEFLTDEVSAIASAALVDRGFVLSSIAATLDQQDDAKHLVLEISPGPSVKRREIAFRGNRAIPSDRLQMVLAAGGLERAAWLDPDALVAALETFYRREGYLSADVRVGPIAVAGSTATRQVDVDEGELVRLREIRFDGARASSADDLARIAGLSSGEPFSQATIDRARQALNADYRTRGFNSVGITLRSEAVQGTAQVDLTITIEEGAQQRLRDIVVAGAERTPPALISRTLRLELGQPVDLAAWYEARRRLSRTGAFRSVDIKPEPDTSPSEVEHVEAAGAVREQPVQATVTVQEWPAVRLRYGLEIEDRASTTDDQSAIAPASETGRTYGLGIAGELGFRNIFGRTLSAGVAGRYTRDFRAARVYTTSPLLFGLPITSNVFLARSREQLGNSDTGGSRFVTDKTSLTLEQRFKPAVKVEIAYGFTLERNHTFDLEADPTDFFPDFDVTANVARLRSTAIVDTRNDLVDASFGWFHSSDFEYGPEAIWSDLHFTKYLLQQRYYRKAGRVVLASSARFGVATAFDQTLLPSERFFAGGGNSVRGYSEDAVSPRDPFFGDPIGGNALLILNQELRFPIFKIVRGVGFLDAGRAFETPGQLSFANLAVGTGFGLRVQTPVALIRVDFGVPLDPSLGPRHGRWFFSIGQAF